MHDQLGRIYHLARRALFAPFWHAPFAAFIAGVLLRVLGAGRAGVAAALAVLAGWLVLILPLGPFAAGPVDRLPGAAVLLALFSQYGSPRRLPGWLPLVLYAATAAWWLRGAPLDGTAVVNLVPVMLGLIAATAIARRLAAGDPGGATLAAAVVLAIALRLGGAAQHWSRAALVTAAAGFALLGLPEATAALAQTLVLIAAGAIVASNRGRLVAVDIAAATPLLVWLAMARRRKKGVLF
jgi:hypothetical protein